MFSVLVVYSVLPFEKTPEAHLFLLTLPMVIPLVTLLMVLHISSGSGMITRETYIYRYSKL